MNFTDRQVQIIEKAMTLIDEGGIQHLTTKNLASHMGFTEPALYRHFKNKTEILDSLLIHYQSVLRIGMEAALDPYKPGLDQIMDIMAFQFQTFSDNPSIIMVIFSEASFQNDSSLIATVTKIMAQKEQRINGIILQGQQDRSINKNLNAHSLTNIIMGAMRFTALRWKLSGFEFDLLEESKMLQQTITTMIKPTH
jgi:AcrR family transcriptional regulator